MKYQHKTNLFMAVVCAVVAAVINFLLYWNFPAAVLGAGAVTFTLSMALNYGFDWWNIRKAKRTIKR